MRKELVGTPKQIAWAEKIRDEYLRHCEYLDEEPIDTESAKFWIEHGRTANARLKYAPVALEAWNYLNNNGVPTREDGMKGLISREAYFLIAQGRVTL